RSWPLPSRCCGRLLPKMTPQLTPSAPPPLHAALPISDSSAPTRQGLRDKENQPEMPERKHAVAPPCQLLRSGRGEADPVAESVGDGTAARMLPRDRYFWTHAPCVKG